jgi:hypothetical protein
VPHDTAARRRRALALALAGALAPLAASPVLAASHREAPLMTLDPAADISDVYAFVSYDADNLRRAPADRKLTLVMNVVPGQEPSSGPNYYAFDDDVLYALHVDHDRDGVDDLSYELRFRTETVTPGQFIATVGAPKVTRLEGQGSEGLSRKQRFSVTEVRSCARAERGCVPRRPLFGGRWLPTVPSNIGIATMPDYADLARQGIHVDAETGMRAFAGQRAETFAIDLGAVFDTINLRVENATPIPGFRPPLPVQTAAEDADDTRDPFGVNAFSGFNVNTIALELPIRRVTRDGQPAGAGNGVIGVYASTSRRAITVRRGEPTLGDADDAGDLKRDFGGFQQVSRMGNPLVNELIIPIGQKDLWNATAPEDEARFADSYRGLAVAGALQLVSGVPVTPPPRNDVVSLLLTYPGQVGGRLSELLRLDLTTPPSAPQDIRRLGPFAHDAQGNPTPDPAGFPNGRRPNDDVTDLVVRVAGGPNYAANYVGDGVGLNEQGITAEFPFLPLPFDGRDRRHRDPGEVAYRP